MYQKLWCDPWLHCSYRLNSFCLTPANKDIDKVGRPPAIDTLDSLVCRAAAIRRSLVQIPLSQFFFVQPQIVSNKWVTLTFKNHQAVLSFVLLLLIHLWMFFSQVTLRLLRQRARQRNQRSNPTCLNHAQPGTSLIALPQRLLTLLPYPKKVRQKYIVWKSLHRVSGDP